MNVKTEERQSQVDDERRTEERQSRPQQPSSKPNGPNGDGLARGEEARTKQIRGNAEDPDVLLDIPIVKVDEISLEVDDLRARVSLHAAVGNLVQLNVGADVVIGRVKLEIKGVEAKALLKVRLDEVHGILARTLETVDKNPELLQSVLQPLGETVGEVGHTARETVPELGKSVGKTAEKTVPQLGGSVGKTVEQTVPEVGKSVGKAAGQILPHAGGSVGKAVGAAGKTVRGVGKSVGEAARRFGETGGEAHEGHDGHDRGAARADDGSDADEDASAGATQRDRDGQGHGMWRRLARGARAKANDLPPRSLSTRVMDHATDIALSVTDEVCRQARAVIIRVGRAAGSSHDPPP